MQTVRAFIAVHIPEDVKSKFGELQRKLMASEPDLRWVKPENAHITLQFLGNTPLSKVEDIKLALRRVAASHSDFEVCIEGLGVFPNQRRPRVVWIGVSRGADSLAALQSSLSQEMKSLGFQAEERKFSPHITLGRVKSPRNLESLLSLLNAERQFRAGVFRAGGIRLIQSILSPAGPTYSTLFSSDLLPPPSRP